VIAIAVGVAIVRAVGTSVVRVNEKYIVHGDSGLRAKLLEILRGEGAELLPTTVGDGDAKGSVGEVEGVGALGDGFAADHGPGGEDAFVLGERLEQARHEGLETAGSLFHGVRE
jgi:hypothetical protein